MPSLTQSFFISSLFFSFHLFSLCTTHSPTPCPRDAPESSKLSVCPYPLYAFTSDSVSLLYTSFIHICLKSVFTFYSPCSFKQPSNCFHSFFSLFPFSLCLRLTSLYIPFISPRCLSLPFYVPLPFPFSTLFHPIVLSLLLIFFYFISLFLPFVSAYLFTLPLFLGPCISLIGFGYFLDSFIQFLCLFYLSQFLH